MVLNWFPKIALSSPPVFLKPMLQNQSISMLTQLCYLSPWTPLELPAFGKKKNKKPWRWMMTELEIWGLLIDVPLIWLEHYPRYTLRITVLYYCFYYEYNNWLTDDKANYCRLLMNMKKVLVYPNIIRGCNFAALWETASSIPSSLFACAWKSPCYGWQGGTPGLLLPILSEMGCRHLPSLHVLWGNIAMSSWYAEETQIFFFLHFGGMETHTGQSGWFPIALLGLGHRGLGHYWAHPLQAVEQGADVVG